MVVEVSIVEKRSKETYDLSSMDRVKLAKLHLHLTNYILALQDGNLKFADRVGSKIMEILGFVPSSVLLADKIRREVHKRLIELARDSPDVEVKVNGRFVIPDVEAVVLSYIDKLSGAVVEINHDSIFVNWESDERTLYDEPVDMYSLSIRWYKGFEKPFVEVEAEIARRFSDADVYMNDVESLDEKEGLSLLRKYNPEMAEEIERDLKFESYSFFVTKNKAYLSFDGSVELPDGRILFVLRNDDSYEYTVAWFFRDGGDVRSGLVEELNRNIGEEFFELDRIYHVYPAEIDAGGPGDSVIHASGSKTFWIEKPSDEVKIALFVGKILRWLPEI